MRITYKMMNSKYTTNLNNLSNGLDKLNTQVATGRKYSKTSEDTSSAIKGYQIRRSLSKVEGYQNNIGHADDFLTNSESALGNVEGSLSDANDKILQGMNGTQSGNERKIIATELRTIQSQLLQNLNTNVSGTYIFGGSNAETKPFTLDGNGKLVYNNVPVDTMTSAQATTLSQDSLYVDIGLGVAFDSSGQVDRNTVFNYSIPGISFVGSGTTSTVINGAVENVSNNVYDLLGRIADALDPPATSTVPYAFDTVDKLYGLFQKATEKPHQSTTEIGSKSNYLTFMTDRYETQDYNYQNRQTEVEGIDTATAYLAFSTEKTAYEAALKMGSNIVQSSVFDYMS